MNTNPDDDDICVRKYRQKLIIIIIIIIIIILFFYKNNFIHRLKKIDFLQIQEYEYYNIYPMYILLVYERELS